jgi:uncharacterized membrane protein
MTTIGEDDRRVMDGFEHVRALAGQSAKLAASIPSAIEQSAELGDPTTADLFTEISRSLDKDLWFLESHLQKK